MSVDMNKIERNIIMSYTEDGVLDIALGIVFLAFGGTLLGDMPWLTTLIGLLAMGVWFLGKQMITYPRMGRMEPGMAITKKIRKGSVLLLTLGLLNTAAILLMVLGGGTLSQYALTLFGLFIGFGITVLAFFTHANRLYYYAFIIFAGFAIGELLAKSITRFDPFPFAVMAAGGLVAGAGLVVMAGFMQKYPKAVEDKSA